MEDRRNAWKAFTRVGIGYGAFLLVTIVIQLGVGVIALLLSRFGMNITFGNWYMVFVSLSNYLVGGVVAWLIIKDMPVLYRPVARKAGAGMLVSGFLVCMSTLFFWKSYGSEPYEYSLCFVGKAYGQPGRGSDEGLSTWSIFVTMVVMAPICEEILFRKILIDRIRLYGDKAAILVSSVVFGLSHGNFYQFFYAFGIGLVLAIFIFRRGSFAIPSFFI